MGGRSGPRAGGDRAGGRGKLSETIEHVARRGLRVVTQPGFIADRGDDYLRDIPAEDHRDLVLLHTPLAEALRRPSASLVRTVLIRGSLVSPTPPRPG
ncbi:hypothetical protein [Actinomadura sp. NBRC 104412]|uniref:hypothetical protein n=1 Tax=Actinomadura sp. NBRC 104412 TaxID=3032203 RepID=UPI00255324BA|nr:hypothetical protein [Actinomadura sp. NBRC 104412]